MSSPRVFIVDVDGVMTTGQFLYSSRGKAFKIFGPDDSEALSLLRRHLEVRFVSSDKRGFKISRARIVRDMGFQLDLVDTFERSEWIGAKFRLEEVVYMGDGIFDHLVMEKVLYAIAPQNGDALAKLTADYVTERAGGDRAVSEACLHISEKFFNSDRNGTLDSNNLRSSK